MGRPLGEIQKTDILFPMRWIGILVMVAGAIPNPAYGGAGCSDACTLDSATGRSCFDDGLGCSPSTFRCERCVRDSWCRPGGSCQNGVCVNVACGGDAGGSSGPGGPDAAFNDAGQIDTGQPLEDAGPSDAQAIDASSTGGRGGRGGVPEKGRFEEDCTCTAVRRPSGPPPGLSLLTFGMLALAIGRSGDRLTHRFVRRASPARPPHQ